MCVFPEGTSHSEAHILHLKGKINYTQSHIYIITLINDIEQEQFFIHTISTPCDYFIRLGKIFGSTAESVSTFSD